MESHNGLRGLPGHRRGGRIQGRVLVADDDGVMRALVREALELDGFAVREARDGGELLDALADSILHGSEPPVDLVVTDLQMPVLSGFEVLAAIASAGWRLPVLVMTGMEGVATRLEARRLGALEVLEKPFALDELCRKARRAVLFSKARRPDTAVAP